MPNVKKPISWAKMGGGVDPWTPPLDFWAKITSRAYLRVVLSFDFSYKWH